MPVKKTDLPTYISGDFNCDVSAQPNRLESILSGEGLHVLNREATYYSSTSARCLEVFACSEPSRVEAMITTSPTLGDHSGVILCRGKHVKPSNTFTRKILDYQHTDWISAREELSRKTWRPLTEETNLDQAASDWSPFFLDVIERNTPTKTIRPRSSDKSWLTPKIRRLMQLRDRAFKRAKKYPRNHPAWRKHKELVRRKEEELSWQKKEDWISCRGN